MNYSFRELKYTILLILSVVIIVALRNTGTERFRHDAYRHALPSFTGSNMVDSAGIRNLEGEPLVIDISSDTVSFRRLAEMAGKHDGPVVLRSADAGMAARVWMVLSQAGINDLYIYSGLHRPESVKEKIRTDSLNSPD